MAISEERLGFVIINGNPHCFRNTKGGCVVSELVKPRSVTSFHDKDLSSATDEINGILKRLASKAERKHLRILETPKGLMLAWVERSEAISVDDDDARIEQALGLAG